MPQDWKDRLGQLKRPNPATKRARLAQALLDPDATTPSPDGAVREARRKLHPDPPEPTGPIPDLIWPEPFDPQFDPDSPDFWRLFITPNDLEKLPPLKWPPRLQPTIPRDQRKNPPTDLREFYVPPMDRKEFFNPQFKRKPEPPGGDPDANVGAIPKEREGESELRTMLRRAYIEDLLRRSRDS